VYLSEETGDANLIAPGFVKFDAEGGSPLEPFSRTIAVDAVPEPEEEEEERPRGLFGRIVRAAAVVLAAVAVVALVATGEGAVVVGAALVKAGAVAKGGLIAKCIAIAKATPAAMAAGQTAFLATCIGAGAFGLIGAVSEWIDGGDVFDIIDAFAGGAVEGAISVGYTALIVGTGGGVWRLLFGQPFANMLGVLSGRAIGRAGRDDVFDDIGWDLGFAFGFGLLGHLGLPGRAIGPLFEGKARPLLQEAVEAMFGSTMEEIIQRFGDWILPSRNNTPATE